MAREVTAARRTAAQAEKFSQTQNWSAAAQEWKRAAARFALLNDRRQMAVAWHNLGEADLHLGNLTEAEQSLERAARINESLGQTNQWWRDHIVLLQVSAQGDNPDALKARFEKLLPLFGQLQDGFLRGLFLNEQGLWQLGLGQLEKAGELFRQAEKEFRTANEPTGGATVRANMARLEEARKNWNAALQTWQAALTEFEKLADPVGITAALAGLGRSNLGAEKYPDAEHYLKRAAENYKTMKARKGEADALDLLAQALVAQGKDAEAKAVRAQAQGLGRNK